MPGPPKPRSRTKVLIQYGTYSLTFVTLDVECVRARVCVAFAISSECRGACVWPWLPERVVVVHIPCVYFLLSRRQAY